MAKQRQVKTSFRSDPYIEMLSPNGKLLYLYLLTNEIVDLCGIYEISLKKICYDTGLSQEEVTALLQQYAEKAKIYYHEGRIIITHFIKNQNRKSPKIVEGINRNLEAVPKFVREYLSQQIPYTDSLIPYIYRIAPYLTLLNLTLPNLTLPHPTAEAIPYEVSVEGIKLNLTKEEHEELIRVYGQSAIQKLIRELCIHIGKTNKQYASHYFTLLERCGMKNIKPLVNSEPVKEEVKASLTDEQRAKAKAALAAGIKK